MDYMFAICFFHSGRFEDLHEDFLTRNNIYVKWWLNLENTMTKSKLCFIMPHQKVTRAANNLLFNFLELYPHKIKKKIIILSFQYDF